jgi:hypothetical protein
VLLKFMLTYGKGWTWWLPIASNRWVGGSWVSPGQAEVVWVVPEPGCE